MARVFISHNYKDKEFASKLGRDLAKKDVRVWIDEAELQVGDSLIRKIENAIAEVDYLAAILSTNSITSEWVKRELEIAITREIHNKRIFVLPLVIDDCDIPAFLKGRMYLDFREKSKYKENLEKILQRLGASQAAPPSPTAKEGARPFAIPVYGLRSDSDYKYIGSIPSGEDGIYVNMIYLTADEVVVDLLIPGSVYEAYNFANFERYEDDKLLKHDVYSSGDLAWIEISIPREKLKPEEVEKQCLEIVSVHNEELRWLLYFANRLQS